MFSRIFNLLFVLGYPAATLFAQTLSPTVLCSLGGQYRAGNAGLSVTLGQTFPAKQAVANNIITAGFEQPQIQINTDTLPVSIICTMQSLNIPYQAWGYIDSGNVFTAQLSDASGSFSNPSVIGTTTGAASGLIYATIPAVLPAGSNYKIRVTSSAPLLSGRVNPGSLSTGSCVTQVTSLSAIADFRCYPNPASDLVYASTPKNVIGKIVVYDMTGKEVLELISTGSEYQALDISRLAQGVYTVTYRNAETNLSTKIIKQ